MPKVKWLMSHEFCSKFHMLSSNAKIFEISTLTADIGWRVWGTPANFNGFCV